MKLLEEIVIVTKYQNICSKIKASVSALLNFKSFQKLCKKGSPMLNDHQLHHIIDQTWSRTDQATTRGQNPTNEEILSVMQISYIYEKCVDSVECNKSHYIRFMAPELSVTAYDALWQKHLQTPDLVASRWYV